MWVPPRPHRKGRASLRTLVRTRALLHPVHASLHLLRTYHVWDARLSLGNVVPSQLPSRGCSQRYRWACKSVLRLGYGCYSTTSRHFPLHFHRLWGVLDDLMMEVIVKDGRPLEGPSTVVLEMGIE